MVSCFWSGKIVYFLGNLHEFSETGTLFSEKRKMVVDSSYYGNRLKKGSEKYCQSDHSEKCQKNGGTG